MKEGTKCEKNQEKKGKIEKNIKNRKWLTNANKTIGIRDFLWGVIALLTVSCFHNQLRVSRGHQFLENLTKIFAHLFKCKLNRLTFPLLQYKHQFFNFLIAPIKFLLPLHKLLLLIAEWHKLIQSLFVHMAKNENYSF